MRKRERPETLARVQLEPPPPPRHLAQHLAVKGAEGGRVWQLCASGNCCLSHCCRNKTLARFQLGGKDGRK